MGLRIEFQIRARKLLEERFRTLLRNYAAHGFRQVAAIDDARFESRIGIHAFEMKRVNHFQMFDAESRGQRRERRTLGRKRQPLSEARHFAVGQCACLFRARRVP